MPALAEAPVAPSFGLNRTQRRWAALVAVALLAIVLVIGVRVAHTTGPLHVDRLSARVVDTPQIPHTRRAFRGLVWLGSPQFVAGAVVLLAGWRLVKRDVLGAAMATVAPLLAVVLTELVAKPLIGRRLSSAGHSFAFPSGHVTGAAALAAVVVALAVREWGARAAWLAVLAVFLPLGVSAGVVRAGFHYATDALGGIAMGFSAVLAVVVLCSAFEDRVPGVAP
ncbi:MAG TPA: phosphatase PAP2 family protein [Acidimicrobiales bacterium]|nr:phosphatase PAP2 family protein [Acidimicrobiales bacterium]